MAISSDYDEPEQQQQQKNSSKPSPSSQPQPQSTTTPSSFTASFDPSKPLAFVEKVFEFVSRESDYLASEKAEKEITALVRDAREKKLKKKREEDEAKAKEEREKAEKRLKEEKKKEPKVEEKKKEEKKDESSARVPNKGKISVEKGQTALMKRQTAECVVCGSTHTWRQDKDRRIRSETRQGLTLFVDNIHPELYNVDLRKIFNKFGTVSDVYISRKVRQKTWKLFGFVRFETEVEAEEAIRKVNGWRLKGENLLVKKADYEKKKEGRKEACMTEKQRESHNVQEFEEEGKEDKRRIEGKISVEYIEWLGRSLVMDLLEPRKLNEVSNHIRDSWPTVSEVRDVGCFRFIVTFQNREAMLQKLEQRGIIEGLKVTALSLWDEDIMCNKRRVWVEIFGVPIHLWNKENMVSITARIGDFVAMDEATQNGTSLESAKVQLYTSFMPFIEDHLFLTNGGKEYEIFLKEIEKHPLQEVNNYGDLDISRVADSILQVPDQAGHKASTGEDDDVAEINGSDENSKNNINERDIADTPDDGKCWTQIKSKTADDDVLHLPMLHAVGGGSFDQPAALHYGYDDMVGPTTPSTRVADVCYNLSQELGLLNQFEEVVDGPPGFVLNEPMGFETNATHEDLFVGANKESTVAIEEQIQLQCNKQDPPLLTVRKRGRPRKSENSTNLSKKKSQVAAESSEEETNNDEEEARKTLAIAGDLNLVAESTSQVMQALINVRRSSRGRPLGNALV